MRILLPVVLLLAGCQGQATGSQAPARSDAPAIVSIGVLTAGKGNSLDKMLSSARMDLSGDTGASASSSASAEQSMTVQIDPEAVGKAITDAAKTFTSPAAVSLVDAAQAELAGGDAEGAQRLVKRAAAAEKAAKAEKPVEEKK